MLLDFASTSCIESRDSFVIVDDTAADPSMPFPQLIMDTAEDLWFLERPKCDYLEYGSRFERSNHCKIFPAGRLLSRFQALIRIVCGIVSQRENFAGIWIHRNQTAALAVIFRYCLGESLLSHILQPAVDGKRDVLAD